MDEPLRIRTRAQFQHIVGSGSPLVITDVADGVTFHPNPATCPYVGEDHFATKVLRNEERNGSYLVVASLAEARASWPRLKRCGWCDLAVIDEGDLGELLTRATGVPVRARDDGPEGVESMMDDWRTTQRVALGRRDDSLVIRSWPAKLREQARAVYGTGVGEAIVALAHGSSAWTARPNPHLAFTTSRPGERFYFDCPLSLRDYVASWSRDEDLAAIRQYEVAEVEASLWPWLCERGYARADDESEAGLARYLRTLHQRSLPPLLRPSIELEWECRGPRGNLGAEIGEAIEILARTLGEDLGPRPLERTA
jgi:hypothetical protein